MGQGLISDSLSKIQTRYWVDGGICVSLHKINHQPKKRGNQIHFRYRWRCILFRQGDYIGIIGLPA